MVVRFADIATLQSLVNPVELPKGWPRRVHFDTDRTILYRRLLFIGVDRWVAEKIVTKGRISYGDYITRDVVACSMRWGGNWTPFYHMMWKADTQVTQFCARYGIRDLKE